jgi:VWFA-related protein
MKKKTSLLLSFILILAPLSANAQTPVTSPSQKTQREVQPADENDVVRITTNLIQVDATVTDKYGKVVSDLRPEDFELFVNGKLQQITNFSFVTVEPQPVEQPLIARKSANKNAPPLPPVRLRPEQVNRTIALVVDDLTLSFTSAIYVKQNLKKFVDEQMQPGDLVAIIRTGAGIGTLQQFTTDKQQLHAVIDGLKYNWLVGRLDTFNELGGGPMPQGKIKDTEDRGIKGADPGEKYNNDHLVRGSLAATKYIVEGMRGLPGRKAVMLLSEGFSLVSDDDFDAAGPTRDRMKMLIDSANRSGVVIYAMDARGLVSDGLNPIDVMTTTGMTSKQIMTSLRANREAFWRPLDGMMTLTEQTGGFTVYQTNDLAGGIRKALDDQKSYYLIGYQPDASTFEAAKTRFNRLTVKVKRPGLKVRYRSGFFGIKDEDRKPTNDGTPQQQIVGALLSPFASNGISLRLTPLFGNDAKAGSFVRSLVHISAKDLTFTDKADGMHEAVINIVAYTFVESGLAVDSVGETHTITLTDKLYQRALDSGLVYSLNVPIKNAGAYQLRVAVRDSKSEKVGSASQFINIPDIKKDKLMLSGIALSSYDPKEEKSGAGDPNKQAAGHTTGDSTLTQAALRRFRTGHVLRFAYAIYNATIDKRTGQSQLTTQAKLYRDGKEIFAGQETPYDAHGQLDLERLVAEGGLQLGGLQPGEYVLQVIVRDALAKGKNRTTTNWIDFEIVK